MYWRMSEADLMIHQMLPKPTLNIGIVVSQGGRS
jgi:hypothetical protein